MAAALACLLRAVRQAQARRRRARHGAGARRDGRAEPRSCSTMCLAFLSSSPALQKEIASTTRSEIRLQERHRRSRSTPTASARYAAVRCAPASSTRSLLARRHDGHARHRGLHRGAARAAHDRRHAGRHLLALSPRWSDAREAQAYFGTDSDDTLVVQGPRWCSTDARPGRHRGAAEADPTAARSEWDAEFRDDLAGFLDDELDRACG